MKVLKVVFLTGLALIATDAGASEILHCQITDEVNLTSSLDIYQSGENYTFDLSTCEGSVPDAPCGTSPYLNQGPISRDLADGKPAMTFKNQDVSIIYLFGEYQYFEPHRRFVLNFPDESCQTSAQNDGVTGRIRTPLTIVGSTSQARNPVCCPSEPHSPTYCIPCESGKQEL